MPENTTMTTCEIARIISLQLKRKVCASEINPIAKQLGKEKVKKIARAGSPTYMWNESEVKTVINLL